MAAREITCERNSMGTRYIGTEVRTTYDIMHAPKKASFNIHFILSKFFFLRNSTQFTLQHTHKPTIDRNFLRIVEFLATIIDVASNT